jgi:hypothetical protein
VQQYMQRNAVCVVDCGAMHAQLEQRGASETGKQPKDTCKCVPHACSSAGSAGVRPTSTLGCMRGALPSLRLLLLLGHMAASLTTDS